MANKDDNIMRVGEIIGEKAALFDELVAALKECHDRIDAIDDTPELLDFWSPLAARLRALLARAEAIGRGK